MIRFVVLTAILATVLLPASGVAQEPEPLLPGSKGAKPDPGPLPERERDPLPDEESDTTPVAPNTTAVKPSKPVDPRPTRGTFDGMLMLGAGAVSMPGTDTESGFAPGLFIGHRSAFLVSDQFGFRWSSRLLFHDFQAVEDYYGWYNQGTADEVELKYLFLWPGLLFGPFIGANYGTGFGFILYTSPRNPALYFDAGLGVDLFLNPSDSFGADVGFSADASIGIDFNELVGMGFMASWGAPFFHGLFDGGGGDIPSFVVYISIL